MVVAMHCKTGAHRAYVTAEVANSITNSLVNSSDGTKLFESQVFHIPTCTSKRDTFLMMKHAWDWSSSDAAPWATIAIPNTIFGKAGCLRSREASAAIDQLEDYIVDVQTWWDSQISPGLPVSSPELSQPSPSPSLSPVDEHVVEASPPRRPSFAAPATLAGDVDRLQAKRKLKNAEAPHVLKASSDHD